MLLELIAELRDPDTQEAERSAVSKELSAHLDADARVKSLVRMPVSPGGCGGTNLANNWTRF